MNVLAEKNEKSQLCNQVAKRLCYLCTDEKNSLHILSVVGNACGVVGQHHAAPPSCRRGLFCPGGVCERRQHQRHPHPARPYRGRGPPSDYCAVETAKQFIPARGTASMSAKWGGAQTSHPLVALYGACVPLKAQRRQEPARPRATHPVARGILFFGRTAGTTDGVTISHLLYFMT
jgi:hypothetical protein